MRWVEIVEIEADVAAMLTVVVDVGRAGWGSQDRRSRRQLCLPQLWAPDAARGGTALLPEAVPQVWHADDPRMKGCEGCRRSQAPVAPQIKTLVASHARNWEAIVWIY